MKTYKINHVTLPDAEHPYKELAGAIIIQACNDYMDERAGQATFRKTPRLMEVLRFFSSEYFTLLTDIEPEYLLKGLEHRITAWQKELESEE